jgi:hypothetical protein
VTIHHIADDLNDHSWYEELFVRTIADVEAYAARWAAFEQAVATIEERPTGPLSEGSLLDG